MQLKGYRKWLLRWIETTHILKKAFPGGNSSTWESWMSSYVCMHIDTFYGVCRYLSKVLPASASQEQWKVNQLSKQLLGCTHFTRRVTTGVLLLMQSQSDLFHREEIVGAMLRVPGPCSASSKRSNNRLASHEPQHQTVSPYTQATASGHSSTIGSVQDDKAISFDCAILCSCLAIVRTVSPWEKHQHHSADSFGLVCYLLWMGIHLQGSVCLQQLTSGDFCLYEYCLLID